MLRDMRSDRRQRLYVYGRFTFLSRFSLITLQPLTTIVPHIMEQVLFLQR